MTDLTKRLTTLQIEKLKKQGILSLYDLVTFMPRDLKIIRILENVKIQIYSSDTFAWEGTLLFINKRMGKRPFLVLDWQGESQSFSTYFFSSVQYLIKSLVIGRQYQILVKYSNGFWSLEKFTTPKKPLISYIQPIYEKRGELQSAFFQAIHNRLQTEDYVLNLVGLVPESELIPQVLDLSSIHHPTSRENYDKMIQTWIMFTVFLRMMVIRSTQDTTKTGFARSGLLDEEFACQLQRYLPFSLSSSQQTVINDILRDITQKSNNN